MKECPAFVRNSHSQHPSSAFYPAHLLSVLSPQQPTSCPDPPSLSKEADPGAESALSEEESRLNKMQHREEEMTKANAVRIVEDEEPTDTAEERGELIEKLASVQKEVDSVRQEHAAVDDVVQALLLETPLLQTSVFRDTGGPRRRYRIGRGAGRAELRERLSKAREELGRLRLGERVLEGAKVPRGAPRGRGRPRGRPRGSGKGPGSVQ